MNVVQVFVNNLKSADKLAIGFFVAAALYAIISEHSHTIIAGIAFVLMIRGALPKQAALALLVGASVILLLQTHRTEGFESGSAGVATVTSGSGSGSAPEEEPFKNKVVLPDHADRKEALELGKAYKLPSESDDKGFHLDSGTTFMNAYKALKPEQIAAMTKDTQELMNTQRNLMSTLDALKPMLKDGQNMMNMFGSFMGPKQ